LNSWMARWENMAKTLLPLFLAFLENKIIHSFKTSYINFLWTFSKKGKIKRKTPNRLLLSWTIS
jgi:hypothetical protein